MRPFLIPLLLGVALTLPLPAQEGLMDGPHQRVLMTVVPEWGPDGQQILTTNAVVQIEPGLNRWDGKQWVETQPGLEIIGNTVVARSLQQHVIWAANAKTAGAVDIELPDGARLSGHCLGLSYYDAASGKSVLIAEVKDSIAEVHPPDIVVYPDVLDDVKADLIYINRRGLFEQMVVLQAPPATSPEDYGMDPATTRLEVISEFINAPGLTKSPHILRREMDPRRRAVMVEPDLVDHTIDFGAMHLGPGQAFLPAGDVSKLEAAEFIPTAKRWEVMPDGRMVLFEAVEYGDLRPLLASLEAKPAAKNVEREAGSHLIIIQLTGVRKGAG